MAEEKKSSAVIKIIEEIEKLSVLELNDLVKALEEKFGVQAIAPMGALTTPQAGGPGAPGTEAAAAEPEQTVFNVVLANAGAKKIAVIKAVREINQQLGLKEAKDLVEAAPKEILTAVNKTVAQEAKKKLEVAGATVELK